LTTDLIKAFLDYKEADIFLKSIKDTNEKTNSNNGSITYDSFVWTKPKINSISRNQKETVDLYFDAKVADPYRWLEDDRSAETAAWLKRRIK
jgi:hypothetical protein